MTLPAISELNTTDGASPKVTDWKLNIDLGTLTIIFSEATAFSQINYRAVTLQNSQTSSVSYTLTGGEINPASDTGSKTVVIDLVAADLNALKKHTNLATGHTNSFLTVSPAFIKDTGGNAVIPIRNGNALELNSVNYTSDSSPPVISQWALNFNTNQVLIQFNEIVDVSSINIGELTIQNAPSGSTFISLQSSSVAGTNSTIVKIDLSQSDLNRLNQHLPDNIINNELYLTAKTNFINDLSMAAVESIENGQALKISGINSNSGTNSFTDRATKILSKYSQLQLSGESVFNNGGFYDAYIVKNGIPQPAGGADVTTGNNAWMESDIITSRIGSGIKHRYV